MIMPFEQSVSIPGGTLHTLQWAGPGGLAPHLIFAHATGMCAAIYAALLAPLSAQARITAYDARGHGGSLLPAEADQTPTDWHLYGDDLRALAAALGGGPFLLAGHSMGATSSFEAAVAHPGLATRMLLIDPPFIPFDVAESVRRMRDSGAPMANPMADRAVRRSAHFPSRAAARAAWAGRGVFAGWPDAALDAYISGGLHDAADGGVSLACTPAWEAATFRGISTTAQDSFRAARLPFAVLAAEHDSTVRAAEEAVIRALHPEAPFYRVPGSGHFLPVTHPDAVREWLYGLISGAFPAR